MNLATDENPIQDHGLLDTGPCDTYSRCVAHFYKCRQVAQAGCINLGPQPLSPFSTRMYKCTALAEAEAEGPYTPLDADCSSIEERMFKGCLIIISMNPNVTGTLSPQIHVCTS